MSRRTLAVGIVALVGVLVGSLLIAVNSGAAAGTAAAGAGPSLRTAGRHEFTATDPGTRWEVREEGSDDVVSGTGAAISVDLPASDGEPTSYEISADDRTERVTVLPADTVTRLPDTDLPVYAVVPGSLTRATHVLLVMHGQGRNAEEYCESWVDWAGRADHLVLCPEFDDDDWSGSAGYNLGNVFTEDDGAGEVNPEQEWAFTVAEQVHRDARAGFGLDDELFDMWGHSAGAQFVHRFLIFRPDAPVRWAIAANAGWYTALEPGVDIPYGTRHPELDLGATAAREHLVLMRGELDVERDDNVRTDPGAEAQGRTRYDRAGYAHAAALAADPASNWRLVDVPGSDHDQVAMSAAAQEFLLAVDGELPRSCPLPGGDRC